MIYIYIIFFNQNEITIFFLKQNTITNYVYLLTYIIFLVKIYSKNYTLKNPIIIFCSSNGEFQIKNSLFDFIFLLFYHFLFHLLYLFVYSFEFRGQIHAHWAIFLFSNCSFDKINSCSLHVIWQLQWCNKVWFICT